MTFAQPTLAKYIQTIQFCQNTSRRDGDSVTVWDKFANWRKKNQNYVVLGTELAVLEFEQQLTVLFTTANS